MITCSVDEIADLLNVSPRRMQQMVSAGIVPKTAHGEYEVRDCVRAYIKYLRARAVVGESSESEGLDDKARLLKFKADIAQYEAERMAGRLVEVDTVARVWCDVATVVRARLVAVPYKLAPLVVSAADIPEAYRILEEAIHECLTELSNMPIEVVEEMPAANDDPPDDDDLEDAA